LSREEWKAVVRSVDVQNIRQPLLGPSYRGATEPAFTEQEMLYLEETLQQAFRQVTAQQLVVFALARTSDEGLLQLTSGAWFSDDGKIHLQLANYRVTVTMPSIRRQIWADPLFAQAGAFYEPVPGPHQQLVSPAAGDRTPFHSAPVELAIDYHALAERDSAPFGGTPKPLAAPSSLEDQLALLKRLFEQGLITEEDYRAKKKEMLDRL
jgi:hypothetical protein